MPAGFISLVDLSVKWLVPSINTNNDSNQYERQLAEEEEETNELTYAKCVNGVESKQNNEEYIKNESDPNTLLMSQPTVRTCENTSMQRNKQHKFM